jgi:hypothetical protein
MTVVFHLMKTGSCCGHIRPTFHLLCAVLMFLIPGLRWIARSATPDPIPTPSLQLEQDAFGGIRCSCEAPSFRWVVETSPGLDHPEWMAWPPGGDALPLSPVANTAVVGGWWRPRWNGMLPVYRSTAR